MASLSLIYLMGFKGTVRAALFHPKVRSMLHLMTVFHSQGKSNNLLSRLMLIYSRPIVADGCPTLYELAMSD